MFAVDMCRMPETGGSTFVLIAGLFLLVAGVIVARWVRQSAGRLSVVVAPLVLLGGLVLVPQVADPCAPATTTVPSVTTLATTNSTVPSATTTVAPTTTTTTTSTTTTTTLAPVVYQVGQAGPGGGIIFYKDLQRAVGSQYFEVACAGWSDGICGGNDLTDPQAVWGCQGTLIAGADGTAIGTGEQNTTDIVNIVGGCSTSGIAARLANDLTLGGQSDWFLPSKDELNQMYTNLHSASTPLGGFLADVYWSSSEEDDIWVGLQFFNTGSLGSSLKAAVFYVRPVRAF
jgi:hypothetical protein